MDNEARSYFINWRNNGIYKVNETPNDEDVDNRIMKQPLIVAKLSLIIQVMRWACGESHLQFVDIQSVKSAIRIYNFFEDSYTRIEERIAEERMKPQQNYWLDLLPTEFETKQAKTAGEQLSMSVRTVMKYLSDFTKAHVIKKVRHGVYQKIFPKDNE